MRLCSIILLLSQTICAHAQNSCFNTVGLVNNPKKVEDISIPVGHHNEDPLPSDSICDFYDYSGFTVIPSDDAVPENKIHTDEKALNLVNLYREMERVGLQKKFYVMAQAILETGFFSSNVCHSYNNIFGLYNSRKKDYYRFDRWQDSVDAYQRYIQYKYKGGDYLLFLKNIGYAEDTKYIMKVSKIYKRIANALTKSKTEQPSQATLH